ncbi:MAG: hypothetical protein ACKOZX_04220, partial [Gammaproteobacteria bacterium]
FHAVGLLQRLEGQCFETEESMSSFVEHAVQWASSNPLTEQPREPNDQRLFAIPLVLLCQNKKRVLAACFYPVGVGS